MKFAPALVATLLLGSGFAHAQRSTPAPSQTPPPPPEQLPLPPQQQIPQRQAQPGPQYAKPTPDYQSVPEPAPQAAPAQGQWIYTQQYGWVWTPYGSQYMYTPTRAGIYPSEYVYNPSVGWTWVTAPWIFGWGVKPYFGVIGPWHYPWYNHVTLDDWRGYGPAYGYGRSAYGYGRSAYGGYRPGYVAPRAYRSAVHSYGRAPVFGGHQTSKADPAASAQRTLAASGAPISVALLVATSAVGISVDPAAPISEVDSTVVAGFTAVDTVGDSALS